MKPAVEEGADAVGRAFPWWILMRMVLRMLMLMMLMVLMMMTTGPA